MCVSLLKVASAGRSQEHYTLTAAVLVPVITISCFSCVFCLYSMSCFSWHVRADDLSSDMSLQGLVVQCLHGGHEQCDREEALQDFKDGMEQGAEMCF